MFFGFEKIYVDPLLLESKNPYFRKLDISDKEKFVARVQAFAEDKDFEGREGLEITDEIKIMVSATAVQLTFGYEEYLLTRFHTIILYPTIYFSRLGQTYHKGETSAAGVVVFAWDHFKEGYAHTHDRINLGLHEWAHALMVSGFFEDGGADDHFREYFTRWQMEAQDEFDEIEAHKSLFREYGGTSMPEFFAICTEVFFEDADAFKTQVPSLFRHFCILLNQYPFGRSDLTDESESHITDHVKIVITPEDADVKNMVLSILLFASIFVFITLLVQSTEVIWISIIGILYILASTLYTTFGYGNQIAISAKSLKILDRKNNELQSFMFNDITSVSAHRLKTKDEIYFSYLLDGTIFEKKYFFRYNDEKLKVLKEIIVAQNIPFKLSKNN